MTSDEIRNLRLLIDKAKRDHLRRHGPPGCEWCGQQFHRRHSTQRFCRATCRVLASRHR